MAYNNDGLIDPDALDPYTGLPALPEGAVWVVTPWGDGIYDYEVVIYFKRRYWFGRYKSAHYWDLFEGHTVDDLVKATKVAVENGNARVVKAVKKNKSVLAGTYPPKSVA